MVKEFRLKPRLNEKTTTLLDIREEDGTCANGVYFVSAQDEAFRLVCVTDIGLSVRKTDGCVYVWATSLTGGKPIPGLLVSIYGANNILVGEGITDADGWCACDVEKDADTFAVVASKKDGSDTSFLATANPLDETIAHRVGERRILVARCGFSVIFRQRIAQMPCKVLFQALHGVDDPAVARFAVLHLHYPSNQ